MEDTLVKDVLCKWTIKDCHANGIFAFNHTSEECYSNSSSPYLFLLNDRLKGTILNGVVFMKCAHTYRVQNATQSLEIRQSVSDSALSSARADKTG